MYLQIKEKVWFILFCEQVVICVCKVQWILELGCVAGSEEWSLSSVQWHWGSTHVLFPLSWSRSLRFYSSLQNDTEMTKSFGIFRNKYTDQFFHLLSEERGKWNFSTLCSFGGAGILVTCIRTSIDTLQDKGKKRAKNKQPSSTESPAEAALKVLLQHK